MVWKLGSQIYILFWDSVGKSKQFGLREGNKGLDTFTGKIGPFPYYGNTLEIFVEKG